MTYRVSQAKVDKVLKELSKHVPNYQIIYKDEPLPIWWLRVLFAFIAFLGRFNPEINRKWLEDISNGIGRWIIFPSREGYGDLTEYACYTTLRHEAVHLMDMAKNPLKFIWTYLIYPLPIFRSGRAHWEFRGYAQNLIVQFEEFGQISEANVAWIKAHFTGPMYLWMHSNVKEVDTRINQLRDDILSGKVSGINPDISWE